MVHVRHGRTARDAKALAAHLLRRDQNEAVAVAAIVGLAATSLDAALAAMRRLAPRRSAAAARLLGLGLNLAAIRDEATRRYLGRPLAILEDIYHRARRQRDEARGPITDPPSIAEARTREAEARENARGAVVEADEAKARRDALAARTLSGWHGGGRVVAFAGIAPRWPRPRPLRAPGSRWQWRTPRSWQGRRSRSR